MTRMYVCHAWLWYIQSSISISLHKGLVMWRFDVYFSLCLNKLLNKIELPAIWGAMTKISHDYINRITAYQKNDCQPFFVLNHFQDRWFSYELCIEYLLIRKHETDFVQIFQIVKHLWQFRRRNIVNHHMFDVTIFKSKLQRHRCWIYICIAVISCLYRFMSCL